MSGSMTLPRRGPPLAPLAPPANPSHRTPTGQAATCMSMNVNASCRPLQKAFGASWKGSAGATVGIPGRLLGRCEVCSTVLPEAPDRRRGRRHPFDLTVGDALDWWRVEEIEDLRLLRLRAEMRLPGLAWLEFAVVMDARRLYAVAATGALSSSWIGWTVVLAEHYAIPRCHIWRHAAQHRQGSRKIGAQRRTVEVATVCRGVAVIMGRSPTSRSGRWLAAVPHHRHCPLHDIRRAQAGFRFGRPFSAPRRRAWLRSFVEVL